MIIYEGLKTDFLASCENDCIAEQIEQNILKKLGRHTPRAEYRSWENSLNYMYKVLNDKDIPNDVGVAIEYNIPWTSKRIDFILSGYNVDDKPVIIIVELKQWKSLEEISGTDAIVETFVGGAKRRVVHPSYQAQSYAQQLRDYNAAVQRRGIDIFPCACLHNYLRKDTDPVDAEQYQMYISKAPLYTKGEISKFRDFIKSIIKRGDKKAVLYLMDSGEIRPSKSLQNVIGSMLRGNKEFTMIDEQKVAYEEILRASLQSQNDRKKRTIIVRGGPGTGKTVIAINLLAELTQRGQQVQYVSRNLAPRRVYLKKLKGQIKKSSVDNMFKGAGTYVKASGNAINTLLVDDYGIIGLSQKAA